VADRRTGQTELCHPVPACRLIVSHRFSSTRQDVLLQLSRHLVPRLWYVAQSIVPQRAQALTARTPPSRQPPLLSVRTDCSTQGLKVVASNPNFQVVHEAKVDFSSDLPLFGTTQGVHVGPSGEVNAPVAMYLEAIDLLFARLQDAHFAFDKVVSISGAGQQHACVLFNARASDLLQNLSPNQPIAGQLKGAFSSPTVTNWQDSSTTSECAAIEAELEGGRDEMARVTGSKAHERFTGPQIRKLVTKGVGRVWEETDKIALVSNALATILCADGEIKPYDEVRRRPALVVLLRADFLTCPYLCKADACGMNLYSYVLSVSSSPASEKPH
jgi:hypothetical protein